MLQFDNKKVEPDGKRDRPDTRRRFLQAFEQTCGNVSASCEYAGISRQTYYRWMQSLSAVNIKFRNKIKGMRPQDRLVDLAESKLIQRINEGEIAAIIYTLKSKGKHRGWTEKSNECPRQTLNERLSQAEMSFQLWLDDNPAVSPKEKSVWLRRFAENAEVGVDDLLQRIGANFDS